MPAHKPIYLSPPDTGELEKEYMQKVLESGWVAPVGPFLQEFEETLAGQLGEKYHCLALNSGTAALHLSLLLHNIQPGDRVYVSSLTFAASANAILYCRAIPVLIDSELASWNMCPQTLEKALQKDANNGTLPKAIMTVDLYGNCCDYDRIVPLAKHYGVPVIQDAAEALGASYGGRPAGTQGDVAVFSFNGNKILTTGGGGALVSSDPEKVERARYLATQARSAVLHYEHEEIGYNYRMSNVLAALGCAQLRSLSAKKKARRKQYEFYGKLIQSLPGLHMNPIDIGGVSNCWLSCVWADPEQTKYKVDSLRKIMAKDQIEARPIWKPLHLQPFHGQFRFFGSGVAEEIFQRGLCLPSGSSLTDGDRERIGKCFTIWLGAAD